MNTARLEQLLARNYTALGFHLVEFRTVTVSDERAKYVQGEIRCPCGRHEMFSLRLENASKVSEDELAVQILSGTASRSHLQKDVEDGTLPYLDINKHCFTGTLLHI